MSKLIDDDTVPDDLSSDAVLGAPASLPAGGRPARGRTGWRSVAIFAFVLYLLAQALPPFQTPRLQKLVFGEPGIIMTYSSFVGLLFYDGSSWMGRGSGIHGYNLLIFKLACLMGAAANVLIVVASVATWFRKDRFAFRAAMTATALAVLVLLPLGYWRDLTKLNVGYLCWAGSAGLLARATWRLSAEQKCAKAQSEI
jgi:hypothetical protein